MDKNLNKVELGNFSGEVLQFNLNKNNDEIFMDTFVRSGVETEAEYWRNIIFTYINNLRYKRELNEHNDSSYLADRSPFYNTLWL